VTELSTHTFELDLTSVCVSSGTLQLPLKMQQYFTPGRVPAEVDGQAMELEFNAPRRLAGLREHFAERGLRSNDRVRFELQAEGGNVVGLKLTCVRRERPKAAEAPATKEQGKAAHVKPVDSSWESGGGVRVVTRVRIPGLAAAPGPAELVSSAASRDEGEDRSSADRGTSTSTGSTWSSVQEQEVFDDGITTVRAVRRRGSRTETNRSAEPAGDLEPAAPADVPARARLREEVVRPISGPAGRPAAAAQPDQAAQPPQPPAPLQLSDLIAPPLEEPAGDAGSRRSRRWVLPPRLRSTEQAVRRQPHTSGPSRGRTEEPLAAAREPSRGEARETSPLGQAARLDAADRDADPRAAAPPAGPVRAADQSAGGQARELIGAVARTATPSPTARAAPAEGGNGDGNVNPFRAAQGYGEFTRRPQAQAPAAPQRPLFEATTSRPSPRPASSSTTSPEPISDAATAAAEEQGEDLGHTLLIDDADFGGEYLEPLPGAPRVDEPAPGSLEADIALVEEYLRSPGTPAIVRSEAVGELLGIGHERAERALERISEEPDSVSRIRHGAYMVRRRPG
jgi:hypothetical protein